MTWDGTMMRTNRIGTMTRTSRAGTMTRDGTLRGYKIPYKRVHSKKLSVSSCCKTCVDYLTSMEVLDLGIIGSMDSFMGTYSLPNMMDSQSFVEQYQQIQKTEELGGERDENPDENEAMEEEVLDILKDIPDSFWSPWAEETTNAHPNQESGGERDEKIDDKAAMEEDLMNDLKDISDSFWSPWSEETANAQPNQKISNKIRCAKCEKHFSKSWIKKHRCKPIPRKGRKQPAARRKISL